MAHAGTGRSSRHNAAQGTTNTHHTVVLPCHGSNGGRDTLLRIHTTSGGVLASMTSRTPLSRASCRGGQPPHPHPPPHPHSRQLAHTERAWLTAGNADDVRRVDEITQRAGLACVYEDQHAAVSAHEATVRRRWYHASEPHDGSSTTPGTYIKHTSTPLSMANHRRRTTLDAEAWRRQPEQHAPRAYLRPTCMS